MVVAAELDPADSIWPSPVDLQIQVGHRLNARKRLNIEPGSEIENALALGLTPRREEARTQVSCSKQPGTRCPLPHAIVGSGLDQDTDACIAARNPRIAEAHPHIEVALRQIE